jgi:hypothetical protein
MSLIGSPGPREIETGPDQWPTRKESFRMASRWAFTLGMPGCGAAKSRLDPSRSATASDVRIADFENVDVMLAPQSLFELVDRYFLINKEYSTL